MDGLKDMSEGRQAYWLINLILSHQKRSAVMQDPNLIWDIIVYSRDFTG